MYFCVDNNISTYMYFCVDNNICTSRQQYIYFCWFSFNQYWDKSVTYLAHFAK